MGGNNRCCHSRQGDCDRKIVGGRLARANQCAPVWHLCLNLAAGRTENLVDSPDVIARITKELISSAVQGNRCDGGVGNASEFCGCGAYMGSENRVAEHADGWWCGVRPDWPWSCYMASREAEGFDSSKRAGIRCRTDSEVSGVFSQGGL
jgi:hypothetical protein